MKISNILNKPKVCNKCKEPAKIWYNNKWWCALDTNLGEFNVIGYCKKDKKE